MEFAKDYDSYKRDKEKEEAIAVLKEAIRMIENDEDPSLEINEGLFGGAVGAVTGLTIGPAIGEAICKALGVNRGSLLWNLLTSRAFTTLFGAYAGHNK